MNKKVLSIIATSIAAITLCSVPTTTASAIKIVKVRKSRQKSKSKKHSKKIPYKVIAGAQPIKLYITHTVRLYSYNLKAKKIFKSNMGASQIITVKPGTHNSWIVVSKIGYNNHGYLNVIKQHSGWYITQDELNEKIQNQRKRFNGSLQGQVGSAEYRAWQNKLNKDRGNIKGWIDQN